MRTPRLIPERIEGRHVLLALLGFFGIMFLVNGVFLYYAVGTFNGFETREAYKTGLTYNARIASDSAQTARGWQPVARYESAGRQLVVEVRNAQGHLVAGLTVSGEIRRPVTDRQDRPVKLQEVAPGRYAVPVALNAGQWVFSAQMAEAGSSAIAYRLKQRLWVKEE